MKELKLWREEDKSVWEATQLWHKRRTDAVKIYRSDWTLRDARIALRSIIISFSKTLPAMQISLCCGRRFTPSISLLWRLLLLD